MIHSSRTKYAIRLLKLMNTSCASFTDSKNKLYDVLKQLFSIFVHIEPSPVDQEIIKCIVEKQLNFQTLEFPDELQDETLWRDAICTFDKFSKEETPNDKLDIVMRTIRICSHVYHMASIKEGREMTFDEEIQMLTYVITKSTSSQKLYSNF